MQVEPCEIPLIEDAAGGAVRGIANQPEADKKHKKFFTMPGKLLIERGSKK